MPGGSTGLRILGAGGGRFKPGLGARPSGPLADGLVAAYLCTEGGGPFTYDSSGRGDRGTLSASGVTWGAGDAGPVLRYDGLIGNVDIPATAAATNLNEVTVLVKGRWNPSQLGSLVNLRFDGANEVDIGGPASVTSLRLAHSLGGVQKTQSLTLAANDPFYVAMTASKSRDQFAAYSNGVLIGSVLTGLGTLAGQPTFGRIGEDAFGGNFGGDVELVYVYTRALSAAEIQALTDQPYLAFRQLRRVVVPLRLDDDAAAWQLSVAPADLGVVSVW